MTLGKRKQSKPLEEDIEQLKQQFIDMHKDEHTDGEGNYEDIYNGQFDFVGMMQGKRKLLTPEQQIIYDYLENEYNTQMGFAGGKSRRRRRKTNKKKTRKAKKKTHKKKRKGNKKRKTRSRTRRKH